MNIPPNIDTNLELFELLFKNKFHIIKCNMILYYHNHLFCYLLSLVLVSVSVFLDIKSFRISVMFSFNISY
jgi:hypothetical protein